MIQNNDLGTLHSMEKLKQLSLADSLSSEHEALIELDAINELIDWESIEHHLGEIQAKRRGNKCMARCVYA